MLDNITPVLLTYNEEQNIVRTLSRLTWATDIVVVDSGSTDGTVSCLREFPNVRVFSRRFDTHAKQWRYATEETRIGTEWLLRLDADYQVTDAFVTELAGLTPTAAISAYRVSFDYAIFSRKLRSSLYPPNTILLRKGCFTVRDKGHTEVWDVHGSVAAVSAKIMHDDRKPTGQWLIGQTRYMQRELDGLHARKAEMVGWLRRRPPFMPIVTFLYCLFGKGLILNGRSGMFYALQRLVAEAVLSLMVLEEKLRRQAEQNGDH